MMLDLSGDAMTTDQPEKKRRPPAGGLDDDDMEGHILVISGVTYRCTNGELVETARTPNAPTDQQKAEIDAVMDEAFKEVNPHGTP